MAHPTHTFFVCPYGIQRDSIIIKDVQHYSIECTFKLPNMTYGDWYVYRDPDSLDPSTARCTTHNVPPSKTYVRESYYHQAVQNIVDETFRQGADGFWYRAEVTDISGFHGLFHRVRAQSLTTA